MPELKPSRVAGDRNSKSSPGRERVITDTEWLDQLFYSLIYQTFNIISFIKVGSPHTLTNIVTKLSQSDQWKLVLVLTLSLGLGVSCLLILIILHLCGLYRREEAPLLSHHPSPPPVDLDSDMVDYDINTQLYTPLPEPKIMKISHEVS